MTMVNISLSLVLLVTLCVSAWWGYRNHRRFQLNEKIAEDLDFVIANTLETVRKAKEFAQKQQPRLHQAEGDAASNFELNSPEMLSTIVTVLISKYGDVRLSMKDFMIDDNEYVSVYVDTGNQEIVLSMDHTLDTTDPLNLVNYSNSDDTYH